MSRRRFGVWPLLACVAATVAACGGTGGEPAPGSSSRTATTAASVEPSAPAASASAPSAPAAATAATAATGTVTAVVDGDTIEVDGRTVRLIGMDTPEVGECGYDEATAAMASLVAGQAVTLTAVPGRDDVDRYGRLLRYVDVGGVDVGLREIELGLGIARYDGRDGYGEHPRQEAYVAADAATAGACSTAPVQAAPTTAAPAPVAPAPLVGGAGGGAGGGACDPAYPTVCIPPAPPDLDCADISDRRFAVLAPDPHHFDGDHNGIGCERD